MGEHADDREALEYGGEAPTVEVTVYRHGELLHRELCDSAESAADLAEQWEELGDVECLVDDLSVRHRPGQILEPEAEEHDPNDAYPRSNGSQQAS